MQYDRKRVRIRDLRNGDIYFVTENLDDRYRTKVHRIEVTSKPVRQGNGHFSGEPQWMFTTTHDYPSDHRLARGDEYLDIMRPIPRERWTRANAVMEAVDQCRQDGRSWFVVTKHAADGRKFWEATTGTPGPGEKFYGPITSDNASKYASQYVYR